MPKLTDRSYRAGTLYGGRSATSRRKLASFIGPVVYYVRTRDDLIKIGHTANVERRVHKLGPWQNLLALTPGTRQDEQELHEIFAPHCARGVEYYHPDAQLLDHIDKIREGMGVPPVERW